MIVVPILPAYSASCSRESRQRAHASSLDSFLYPWPMVIRVLGASIWLAISSERFR